ncbi:MAG TPA: carbamoyltransferase HypF [Halothiobacillus sp.]|jgi:[NiFe] hydrogenase maturation protein HypF|nr:carbamoyltransferase HypF [Halothiobacillus sp.]
MTTPGPIMEMIASVNSTDDDPIDDPVLARRWALDGRVQGVGFRPFVQRLATRCNLTGQVWNCGGQVMIEAQGSQTRLTRFEHALIREAPETARPRIVCVGSIAALPGAAFEIRPSQTLADTPPHLSPSIPPDTPICALCLAEMNDPNNRRHRYPFTHCDQCGPRYTLIDRLPYDRVRTSLKDFPLCPDCDREYHDPNNRRFHAQSIACPHCGPHLTYTDKGDRTITDNQHALDAATRALTSGAIVAVQGVGGYYLMADATNSAAASLLRLRKHRPDKPLAVMFPWRGPDGLDAVRHTAGFDTAEAQTLLGEERPVVVLPLHAEHSLSPAVAPGLNEVGALLPCAPLHYLLLEALGRPLIATSANISGNPTMIDPAVAEQQLATIADAFLHHNRAIHHRVDDSVYRRIGHRLRPLRLGRGITPLEIDLPWPVSHPVLAVGAQQKNTVCLAWGTRLVLSPHIGDLENFRTQLAFEQQIRTLCELYGVQPEEMIHDTHADYQATRWARASGRDCHSIPHHFAHASALCGEHGRFSEDTLVFTWDGTGLGTDGTLWGGEALIGRPGQWRRHATFEPFPLLGGEAAIRAPWRLAATLSWECGSDWKPAHIAATELTLLRAVWQRRLNCPSSSSVGRLFDAAAALLNLVDTVSHEAQAPTRLEAFARGAGNPVELFHHSDFDGVLRCRWPPLIRHLLDHRLSAIQRAADFHATLVQILLTQAQAARSSASIRSIGLTGGVFQNRRLTEAAVAALAANGFDVLLHERIPCNDAGISFGQVMDRLPALRYREET